MTRSLKVFSGSLDGRHRFCVATTSRARVVAIGRIHGYNPSLHYVAQYWSVTGNAKQVSMAMAAPGTLFRSSTSQGDDYEPVDVSVDGRNNTLAVEMHDILQGLINLSPVERHLEAMRIYEERHKDDLTYRQRRYRLRAERTANPPPRRHLLAEEVAYLLERLEGVNDPVGQSARTVLQAMQGSTRPQTATTGQ